MARVIRQVLPLLLMATPAGAQLAADDLARAKAAPAAGTRLPGELAFRDAADGRVRRLREVVGGRAAIVVFADFTCRHICGPGLALTGAALRRTGLKPGRAALVVIGLDPKDGAASAQTTLARTPGATVLSGDAATVAVATGRLGYGYAYDAASDQFAHDASLYVFAADGRLVSVLPEFGVTPVALMAAFAGRPEPEGVFARVARVCYGFAAAHGRYGGAIVTGLQLTAAAMLVAGGAWLLSRGRAR